MDAHFYFDATASLGQGGSETSGMVCDILARTLMHIHAAACPRTIAFATALPGMRQGNVPHPGNALRFFFDSRDDAETLRDEVMTNRTIRDYVALDRIRAASVTKGSVEYRMVRQRSLKRCLTPPKRLARVSDPVRDEERFRTQFEYNNRLPRLRIQSQSNGQVFDLRIERVIHDSVEPSNTFTPNGWGLGTRTNTFRLPLLLAARC